MVPEYANKAAANKTKILNTFHSAFKKAIAPSAIYPANSCILASPGSCLLTHADLIAITINPKIPNTGTK